MEGQKATTVVELFDMITADNIERLMFDLDKTAHCLVDMKEKHPEHKLQMTGWIFIDDGKHNIKLELEENTHTISFPDFIATAGISQSDQYLIKGVHKGWLDKLKEVQDETKP